MVHVNRIAGGNNFSDIQINSNRSINNVSDLTN